MPRNPRFIPPHSLQHVVDTTFQHRALLRPSQDLNQRFLGVLARAQREHQMTVCAVVALSTHYHLLLRPEDAQHLARFMCYFKTNLAKELGSRLHGWKGHFFAGRFHTTTISQEEVAQVRVLRYILAHGVKEFLVDTVRQWPGVHCAESLITGEQMSGPWFDRTAEYEARALHGQANASDHVSTETLDLSPLPCWQHLEASQWRPVVSDLVDEIDREGAVQRVARGKPSLGVQKILATDPLEMPGTAKTAKSSSKVDSPENVSSTPQPKFHAVSKALLQDMIETWQETLTAYRIASDKLRSGERDAVFPEGTFPPSLPFVAFTEETVTSRGQPA